MKKLSTCILAVCLTCFSQAAYAGGQAELAAVSHLMDSARILEAHIFAPEAWEDAEKEYADARKAVEEGKKNKDPEQQYFVNVDGEEVVKITNKDGEEEWVKISLKERKPFLDEDNKPIKCEESSESEEAKPKRKRKATKAT